MEFKRFKVDDLVPYAQNPRINDWAVEPVMESIRQCGYVAPIVIDENNVILAGHTRYTALRELGIAEADCVVVTGLSDDQKRKFRLLDNKTNELAEWDEDLLKEELAEIDLEGIHWFDDLLSPDVAALTGSTAGTTQKKDKTPEKEEPLRCPRCGALIEPQETIENEALDEEPINWSPEE